MRRIALALAFIAGLAGSAASQPAPVPALPDASRISIYNITASTCACAVNFQLYGDGTDVNNWIQVLIGTSPKLSTDPVFGWTLTSPSGSIGSIALPITNAILTFNSVQTGQVTILGAQRPRRLSQFSENAGVPARALNQAFTTLFAEEREAWDKLNRAIMGQPGEVLNPLPAGAARSGLFLSFDGGGQPLLSGVTSSGTMTVPGSSTNLDLVCFNGTSGKSIQDCGTTVTGLPVADPRNFAGLGSCSGSTDASAAIAAAIAAGFINIRLPAGCLYQPPTLGGNENIPNGINIIGDNSDPNISGGLSLIRTANRATSSDALGLGARGSVRNVAIQSFFCDQTPSPQAVAKVCPIGYAYNSGDAIQPLTNWTYQGLFFITGPTTTQPGPIVSTDSPIMGLIQNNNGDAVFSRTALGAGVNWRMWTTGVSDTGVLVQNGFINPGNIHTGLWCQESGTNANSTCSLLERKNGSTGAILQKFLDDGPGTTTTDWQQWIVSFQTGGNIRNTFQTTTPFSGFFDLINAGNAGGTFTGGFASYQISGVAKYQIDAQGNIFSAGSLTTKPPVTNTGATYSVSTNDDSLIANNVGGTQTLTLLSAATVPGRILHIKSTGTTTTVVSASSNVVPLIGGAAGTAILAAGPKWAMLKSDGTNWIIMAGN